MLTEAVVDRSEAFNPPTLSVYGSPRCPRPAVPTVHLSKYLE